MQNDDNVTRIFMTVVRDLRADTDVIKTDIQEIKVDLRDHMRRTNLNEKRITITEDKMIMLEEKILKYLKWGFSILSSIIALAIALDKII